MSDVDLVFVPSRSVLETKYCLVQSLDQMSAFRAHGANSFTALEFDDFNPLVMIVFTRVDSLVST